MTKKTSLLHAALLSSLLVLGGCGSIANTEFDNVEASRYADIAIMARSAIPGCKDNTLMLEQAVMLEQMADHAHGYSSFKANNPRITEAGLIVRGLIAELNTRYKTSVPSISYCQLKLAKISAAAEVVAKSVGKKELLSPIAID